MAENLEPSVPAPRPTDPDAQYAYGIPDVQEMGIGAQFLNMFAPYRSRVVEPSSTQYIPLSELGMDSIQGEVMRKFTPGQYAEPEFGLSYMPAVQGIASFFSDPVESAKAAGQAIMDIPEQQMRGAEAMMMGYDFAYDPETGQEFRYDPTMVPATTAVGTAISIAREGPGGQVLGIMGGRFAKDGQGKYETAVKLYKEGKSDQEIFDVSKSYLDVDVLGASRNYEDAFRFEMPTANSKLNEKEVFDGRMEGFRSVEIDDEYGSFSVNDAPYARLEQILDFPELYEQYPEIKDLRVARINSFGGAFYDPEKNFIGVADQLNNEKFQSALLHEVQHWVQHKEGFPTGGNAQTIAEQLAYRMDAEDPEMLKGPARDLYQSLYGETEARTVQRRFSDPEEAKLTPLVSRRKESPDTDISMDIVDAVDRGEEALIDALEYGDISYSDIYPETFSGGSGQPLKKGSVGFYPSEKIQRDPDTIYYKGRPIEESSSVPEEFGLDLGGLTIGPETNRFFFEDLGFSEVRLGPSLDIKGDVRPNEIEIQTLIAKPRRSGHGTELMRRLTKQADETGTTLRLTPRPIASAGEATIPVEDLVDFYKKQGFEYFDPDPDNPDIDREMVRYPRKAQGGVVSLLDIAQNMTRGPRGVGSLAPVARNMYRNMVG
jgi:hypothetical protein